MSWVINKKRLDMNKIEGSVKIRYHGYQVI